MRKINIALASDDNYAQHLAVVMASVLENAKQPNQVRFFLLLDGVSEEKFNKIQSTADYYNAEITKIDMSSFEGLNRLFVSGHLSKAAYFRLRLPELLPLDVEKILYMDVDLLVRADIAELYDFDLQGYPVGAVADFGIMASARMMKQKAETLGIKETDSYFNSGVMLIDVSLWRKENYSDAVVELASSGKYRHHDQDALNKVFAYNWTELPLRWNVIPPVLNLFPKILRKSNLRCKAIEARKNIAVLHYAGRYKPWEFAETPGFNEEYYQYLSKTAFAGVSMPQPSKDMQGKCLTRQLLRKRMADFWGKML